MKVFAAIVAALVAVSSTHAATCDLTKLIGLKSNPAVAQCGKDAGFVPPASPTDAQLAAVCKSTACLGLVKAISALGLGDCEVGSISLQKDIVDRINTACQPTKTPTTSTPAPTATTPAPTPASSTPTVTPSPTTTKAPAHCT